MRTTRWISRAMLAASLALLLPPTELDAQGRGKGKGGGDDDRGQERGRGQDKRDRPQVRLERGRSDLKDVQKQERRDERESAREARRVERQAGGGVALRRGDSDDSDRGNRGRNRSRRVVFFDDLRPSLRPIFTIDRPPQRVLVGAVSRAHLRGVDDDALRIVPVNNRVRLLNRSGVLLLDLDEDRARGVGRWEVIGVDDRVRDGAPAFCRSGAGHPVFGREWCVDKGFGLGADRDFRWGRMRLDDVVFVRRVSATRLASDAILALLGPTAFDRLALHAITLGLMEPLAGVWLDDPGGPRVLLLTSGDRPVAELVDRDRDDRPEVLLVARRDW